MTGLSVDDRLELRALADRYAHAVDRNDGAVMSDLFLDEARLQVFRPSDATAPVSESIGIDQLMRIPARVAARYARTFHLIGNALYEPGVASDEATGELLCQAHHLTIDAANGTATDYVMFIRYFDHYRRGGTGAWRIADRQVLVDWSEVRPADPTGSRRSD